MDNDVPATPSERITMRDLSLALDIIAMPMALEVMHHMIHGGRLADVESDDNRADLAHAVAQLAQLGLVQHRGTDTCLTEHGQELWRAYEQVAVRRAQREPA